MITTYYLELSAAGPPREPALGSDGFTVRLAERNGSLNRSFYEQVGQAWHWTDRLAWSDDQWEAYASRPGLETWIATVDGAAAGYFELDRDADGNTEIAYFGLLKEFIGRGLGTQLLQAAIDRAWQSGATRVWVHTCTLDHPHALSNYQARGFAIYRTEARPRQAAPLRQEIPRVS